MGRVLLEDITFAGSSSKVEGCVKDDILICPKCNTNIQIEYDYDSRGRHPRFPIECTKCHHQYGFLFIT